MTRSPGRVVRGGGVVLLALAAMQGGCGGGSTAAGPSSGRLELTVEGLPNGAVPRLVIVGPGNAVRMVGLEPELSDLAPGTYLVSALHVAYGTSDYTATVSPASVTVSNDAAAAATITYTSHPRPTVDYQITSARLLQSVQNAGGGVRMVAGRPALLQVFGTATQSNGTALKVRAYLYRNGSLVDTLTASGPAAVPTSVDLSSLATSWNFTLPANRVVAGLGISLAIDPDDQWGEANELDNRYPGGSTLITPSVQQVAPVKLVLVPVHQTSGSGAVTSTSQASFSDFARHIYPISNLSVTIRAPFSTQAATLQNDDGNGAWGQILSEIFALRQSDHSTATYYGVVHPNYNSGVAGLGYIGLPAAIGWDKGNGVGEVAAHELGHTFGRQHAPCGNPSGPDPNYPYADAEIGVWGYDQGDNTLQAPTTTVDLMSYCSPDWISDYNYNAVFDWLTSASSIQPGPAEPGLLVWGRIVADSLILEPAFRVIAPARLPSSGGPYRVTGTSRDGSTAFDLHFAGELVPDLPRGAERHFAFVVPMNQDRSAALASIRLTGPGRHAVQTASLATTLVAETHRAGPDQVEVTWDARYPLAVIRDAASGEIIGFGRGGRAMVQSRNEVRVDLSRGTHSEPALVRNRK